MHTVSHCVPMLVANQSSTKLHTMSLCFLSLVRKVAHCFPMLVANHSRADRVQSFPSRGAIAYQVSHVKVPSCAYVAHRVPMLPNALCHCMTSFTCHGCHCVLSCPSCGTIVCQQCPLHRAIECIVASQMVPLCAKLPVA